MRSIPQNADPNDYLDWRYSLHKPDPDSPWPPKEDRPYPAGFLARGAGLSFVAYPAVQRQPAKLEFQGALVKVSFPSRGFVRDDDNARFQRCFAKEMLLAVHRGQDAVESVEMWTDLVAAGNYDEMVAARFRGEKGRPPEIHPSKVLRRSDGSLLGAEISPAMRRILSERALNRLQSMKRGLRGVITGYSARSRGRMMEKIARLRMDTEALFLTFTYRENMTDYGKAADHFVKVVDWLEYHYPGCGGVWKKELQDRGAIHYHVLLFGVERVDINALRAYWQGITGDESYPNVKRLRGLRQVLGYVSKYIAKVVDGTSGSEATKFIDVPNSGKAASTGRWWGMFGRANLPFAERIEVTFGGRLYPVVQFRRAAARHWSGLRRLGRIQGFKLFVNCLDDWLRYWDYLCKSESAAL